jgi:predicted HTH transcriptional regulator
MNLVEEGVLMSRAQDAVTRARKEIESEARRVRAEIDKQRKDMEKRLKPLQDQLDGLEDALRRLTGREARKPAAKKSAAKKSAANGRAPRGANKAAILRALKEKPGASAAEIAAATGIKSTVVSSSLTNLAKQGEVKRTKRNGRVTWRAAA